jgi:hypothetical protein
MVSSFFGYLNDIRIISFTSTHDGSHGPPSLASTILHPLELDLRPDIAVSMAEGRVGEADSL